MLVNVAGRALGAVISKFKTLKNVGFSTFSKMYHSHVVPIADYSLGIWGYLKSIEGEKIQNRVIRFYLGVHKKTQILAIQGIWVELGIKLDRFACGIGWYKCQMKD